jgi:hypothetical protein
LLAKTEAEGDHRGAIVALREVRECLESLGDMLARAVTGNGRMTSEQVLEARKRATGFAMPLAAWSNDESKEELSSGERNRPTLSSNSSASKTASPAIVRAVPLPGRGSDLFRVSVVQIARRRRKR